jgi:hypothetical protein
MSFSARLAGLVERANALYSFDGVVDAGMPAVQLAIAQPTAAAI